MRILTRSIHQQCCCQWKDPAGIYHLCAQQASQHSGCSYSGNSEVTLSLNSSKSKQSMLDVITAASGGVQITRKLFQTAAVCVYCVQEHHRQIHHQQWGGDARRRCSQDYMNLLNCNKALPYSEALHSFHVFFFCLPTMSSTGNV